MNAYSKDLRLEALAAVDRGTPRKEEVVVAAFGVSLSALKRRLKRRRGGEDYLTPKPSPGRRRRILATVEERRALWAQPEENDDATLGRHCELWEEGRGAAVSVATMSRAVRERLGWTFKKRSLVASERDEGERSAWRGRPRSVDPGRLVFVDESSTNIAVAPRHGRAPKGRRGREGRRRGTGART